MRPTSLGLFLLYIYIIPIRIFHQTIDCLTPTIPSRISFSSVWWLFQLFYCANNAMLWCWCFFVFICLFNKQNCGSCTKMFQIFVAVLMWIYWIRRPNQIFNVFHISIDMRQDWIIWNKKKTATEATFLK